MPLHTDTRYDPLSSLVQLKTSTVLEMLLSLQTAVDAWRRPELAEEINAALGSSFLEQLREFFDKYHQGCDFAEIGVDTEFHHDVPRFLKSVRRALQVKGRINHKRLININADIVQFPFISPDFIHQLFHCLSSLTL